MDLIKGATINLDPEYYPVNIMIIIIKNID